MGGSGQGTPVAAPVAATDFETQLIADLDTFFDDFTISGTFNHGGTISIISGIFDKERQIILDGYETTRPVFETKTSNVIAITKVTDTLIVKGVTYKIKDYFQSSDGLTTTLILSVD